MIRGYFDEIQTRSKDKFIISRGLKYQKPVIDVLLKVRMSDSNSLTRHKFMVIIENRPSSFLLKVVQKFLTPPKIQLRKTPPKRVLHFQIICGHDKFISKAKMLVHSA